MNTWAKIKAQWLSAYRSREVLTGLSVIKEVGPQDEWCAEAYLDIDYSTITEDTLSMFVKRYLLNNIMLLQDTGSGVSDEDQE